MIALAPPAIASAKPHTAGAFARAEVAHYAAKAHARPAPVIGVDYQDCVAPAGKDRPTEFTGQAGSGQTLRVFRRKK